MARNTSTKIKKAALTPYERERKEIKAKAREAGVPEQIIPHLVKSTVVDLNGDLDGQRMKMVPVLLNRGGSAVDRWIHSNAFNVSQERAIRYTQGLWVRADGKLRAVDTTRDRVDEMIDGMSQQEALDELHRFKGLFPRDYWSVYENVCRFDEEAGTAGIEAGEQPPIRDRRRADMRWDDFSHDRAMARVLIDLCAPNCYGPSNWRSCAKPKGGDRVSPLGLGTIARLNSARSRKTVSGRFCIWCVGSHASPAAFHLTQPYRPYVVAAVSAGCAAGTIGGPA